MLDIVRIGGGHAREHVLIGFARQQIAIHERLLAELGQQGVAGGIGFDLFNQAQFRRFGLAAATVGGLNRGGRGALGMVKRRHFIRSSSAARKGALRSNRKSARRLRKPINGAGSPREPQDIVLTAPTAVNGTKAPKPKFLVNEVLPENRPRPDSLRSPYER